jgi:hypothetical protein
MIWLLRRVIGLRPAQVLVAFMGPGATMALLIPLSRHVDIHGEKNVLFVGYIVGMLGLVYLDQRRQAARDS